MVPLPGRGAVLFAVEDTGCGIADENQAFIFEKFRQVVDPAAGKPRGTGLGLAICRKIVDAHHGTITADNLPGSGCVFRFTLPL